MNRIAAMKSQVPNRLPAAAVLAAGVISFQACTQSWAEMPAGLEIQTYAGLTITGRIGSVYSMEYSESLTEPPENDWRCLEFVQILESPLLWTDKSAPAKEKRFYRAVEMQAPENMVWIPPGTFRMGSPEFRTDRDPAYGGPQMEVMISRGFWMGKFEVTQRDYEAVMGTNPSYFKGDGDRPVETVEWDDAVAYCAALTTREQAAGRIAPNSAYRLPTEAEWEYACRAWTSTRFSYGDDPNDSELARYAWYGDNSGRSTHPVGQKLPNPWGLYDMHGNVREWCRDWYANSYQGGDQVDPQGPTDGTFRVIRGGSFGAFGGPFHCRSAAREPGSLRDGFQNTYGFRVILSSSGHQMQPRP